METDKIRILSEANLIQYGKAVVRGIADRINKDETYWVSLSVDLNMADLGGAGCVVELTDEATTAIEAKDCLGIYLIIAETEEVYLPKLGQKHAYITDFIAGRTLDGLKQVEARMVNVSGNAQLRLKAVGDGSESQRPQWHPVELDLANGMPPNSPPPFVPIDTDVCEKLLTGELEGVVIVNTASGTPDVSRHYCRMIAMVNQPAVGIELTTFTNNGYTVRAIVTEQGYMHLDVRN